MLSSTFQHIHPVKSPYTEKLNCIPFHNLAPPSDPIFSTAPSRCSEILWWSPFWAVEIEHDRLWIRLKVWSTMSVRMSSAMSLIQHGYTAAKVRVSSTSQIKSGRYGASLVCDHLVTNQEPFLKHSTAIIACRRNYSGVVDLPAVHLERIVLKDFLRTKLNSLTWQLLVETAFGDQSEYHVINLGEIARADHWLCSSFGTFCALTCAKISQFRIAIRLWLLYLEPLLTVLKSSCSTIASALYY